MTGFFDGWEEPPAKSGSYVSAAEKEQMVADAVPFEILGVQFEAGGGFQGADRFVVSARVRWSREAPSDRLLSFSAQEGLSRTELLFALINYFAEAKDEAVSPVCYLEKRGRAYVILNYEGSAAEADGIPFG